MKFTPEDFITLGAGKLMAEEYATMVNARIKEWLNSAPVVYGTCHPADFSVTDWSHGIDEANAIDDEFKQRARLVCIEPIKPEEKRELTWREIQAAVMEHYADDGQAKNIRRALGFTND